MQPAEPIQTPDWPRERASLPQAQFRAKPEDFQVEELPAYAPSGSGTHLFVTFRKTGLTTSEALRRLARALGVPPGECGVAGMKDRHAVTTQVASFPCPESVDAERALGAVTIPDIEVLGAARHEHKLKTGHLRGNRFTITLRGLDPDRIGRLGEGLELAKRHGVPNGFGEQRFGREGDNAERALEWLRGSGRGPRDRGMQRLLFSALQSLVFNEVLARRVADRTWNRVLGGDLAKRADSGGIFLVPTEGPELEDAVRRAEAGEICATGPMFGPKMREPAGRPAEIEAAVMAELVGPPRSWSPPRRLGEGTRRPLVLRATDLVWQPDAQQGTSTLGFVLPKGGYATTLLGSICVLVDAHGGLSAPEEAREGGEG